MAKRAFEMPVKALTVIPAIDFKDKRYTFVNFDANGNGITAVAGANAVGIIQEPNGVGQPSNTMFNGISFVVFDGAVAAGDEIEVGTAGKGKKKNTGTVVAVAVVGGADGEIGCCLLK